MDGYNPRKMNVVSKKGLQPPKLVRDTIVAINDYVLGSRGLTPSYSLSGQLSNSELRMPGRFERLEGLDLILKNENLEGVGRRSSRGSYNIGVPESLSDYTSNVKGILYTDNGPTTIDYKIKEVGNTYSNLTGECCGRYLH